MAAFGEQFTTGIVTVALGLIGVATVAVVLSKNANTAAVTQAASSGFASDLEAALAPVDGSGLGSLSVSSPTSF